MQITINPYRRKDGSWMIFVNNDRGVSIGLSEERGFAPYGRDGTPGKRKLWDAVFPAFQSSADAVAFTGDFAAHAEPKADCDPFKLLVTDVCDLGGMTVGEDGAYVVYQGRVLRCGLPLHYEE